MEFYENILAVPKLYIICTITVFMVGACVGSFLNVVIWRLPAGESFITVPSHCPKCQTKIKPWHNIPIFGWLILRGKCNNCKVNINPRYFLVETLTAVLWLAIWMKSIQLYQEFTQLRINEYWHPSYALALVALISLMIVLAFIDIDTRFIPDSVVLFGIAVAIVFAISHPGSHQLDSIGFLNQKPMLKMLIMPIANTFPDILNYPRLLALIDCLSGALFAFLVFFSFAFVGKLFINKKDIILEEAIDLTLTKEGFKDDVDFEDWELIFDKDDDELYIKGTIENFDCEGHNPDELEGEHELSISKKGFEFKGQHYALDKIKDITIKSAHYRLPLIPMGMGDVTLMAMIGAFVGPGSILFITLMGAIIGTIFGLSRILFNKNKVHSPFPFGPSLVLGALVYIFAFYPIIALFNQFLNSLGQ